MLQMSPKGISISVADTSWDVSQNLSDYVDPLVELTFPHQTLPIFEIGKRNLSADCPTQIYFLKLPLPLLLCVPS